MRRYGEGLLSNFLTAIACGLVVMISALASRAGAVTIPASCSTSLDTDLFNPAAYRKYNADLAAQTDDSVLALHWCQHGMSEGRQASEIFASKEYLALNPTIATQLGARNYGAAVLHFVSAGGGREQGLPGVKIGAPPFFTRATYQALNPKKVFATDADARRDFLTVGLPLEGLAASTQFKAKEYFNLFPELLAKCMPGGLPRDYICAAQHYRDVGLASGKQGMYTNNFLSWSALISEKAVSPVTPQAGDLVESWTGADGRLIKAVVQAPHPKVGAPTVTLGTVAPGADARPVFEATIAQAKTLEAGVINIPAGTYVFKTAANVNGGPAHLYLKGLKDVTINGNGSTLVFSTTNHGILIEASQRLKITNIKIDYAIRTTSLGTVILDADGKTKLLKIDDAFPVTSADKLSQLQEYDRAKKRWVMTYAAERALFDPGQTNSAHSLLRPQTYTGELLKNLTVGKTFAVMHHWYSGNAIRVGDYRNRSESEDVWLSGVTIYSGPGMGVLPYGMKRGFAMTGCQIVPNTAQGSFMSVEWDAIHLPVHGGDTILKNNKIARQGDDGLNVNSPVSPLVSLDTARTTAVFGAYSRFMAPGDRIGLFDPVGKYLGLAIVKSVTPPASGVNYTVVLDRAIDATTKYAKDIEIINSRVVIKDNEFEHGAILAQTPNTLIDHNYIHDTLVGVRLVSNFGFFKEGVGATNAIIRSNTITNSGYVMSDTKIPWGTITVVGRLSSGYASTVMHRNILIENNSILGSQESCIAVINTENARVLNNFCSNTNLKYPGDPSIRGINSAAIQTSGNRREGNSTGPIQMDSSVLGATIQSGY
jgi:hypothetical protein